METIMELSTAQVILSAIKIWESGEASLHIAKYYILIQQKKLTFFLETALQEKGSWAKALRKSSPEELCPGERE